MENYPDAGTDEGLKSFVSSQLENAARLVESTLPRRLRSADRDTDSWLQDTLARVAIGIRRIKRGLLTRNLRTDSTVTGQLATLLENTLRENWDQLAQLNTEEVVSPRRAIDVWRFASGLILPLAAFAVTYLLDRAAIMPPPYITICYFISACYTILSIMSFDPRIAEKISNLREIAAAAKDLTEVMNHKK